LLAEAMSVWIDQMTAKGIIQYQKQSSDGVITSDKLNIIIRYQTIIARLLFEGIQKYDKYIFRYIVYNKLCETSMCNPLPK